MGANPEHWLDRLLAERGERLRSFLRRRARPGTEIADLSQEIYLRLLRVPEPEAIANPEAYLFTVAGNLLRNWTRAVAGSVCSRSSRNCRPSAGRPWCCIIATG